MKALQERLSLVKSMEIIKKVQEELFMEPYSGKLRQVLNKNPGFKKFQNASKVLRGSLITSLVMSLDMTPDFPALVANAPIVTVDCERSFSNLKDLLSPKRQSLSKGHIKDMMVIQWNAPLFSST